MTVFEYGNDIIVVDCGMTFPDDEMLGVDLVIPDTTYLQQNADRVRGFLITHGHEDHIGAIPYVLRDLNVPIYCTPLTAGIIKMRTAEHRNLKKIKIHEKKAGSKFKLGCFDIEFINVNHSVPDAVAMAIKSPVGTCIITGDFKIDSTPIGGEMIDLARFGELGKEGVLMLMADSTNAERPGFAMSERKVGAALDAQFKNCRSRILVATFASNVYRLQQIINVAAKYGRKVAVSGRSMENILKVTTELGYIEAPKDLLVDISTIRQFTPEQLCIITTGSQGEPMSALSRMAFGSHKQVEVGPGDKILISASPIPGNEKSVYTLINELVRRGAEVVYDKLADMHVSGHACQEELKLIMALTKPKYFMPVHGEYRHLKINAGLAASTGVARENIFISEIGKVLEVSKDGAGFNGTVPSGKVLVDGLGVGDVGNAVLRDRKHLSQDGLIVAVVTLDAATGSVIAGPDIVSRGFVFMREAEDLTEGMRKAATAALEECLRSGVRDWSGMKATIKDCIAGYIYKKTKRSPMVLPVIMEI
ncbi:ribonuclease J [Acidaminobacterium chupaoyuni]